VGAFQELHALEHSTLMPVQFANAREHALVEGLHGLAAQYGKQLRHTSIDANGELAFIIEGPVSGRGACGQYGEELSALLTTVPTRTGVVAFARKVLPENGWCYINHFVVEKLLLTVEKDFLKGQSPVDVEGQEL